MAKIVDLVRPLADGTRTNAEIAKLTGLTTDQVRKCINRAKSTGWSRKVIDFWTAQPEVLARVVEMWNAGFSAGAIAEKIGQGMTRNMVIGKTRRLGLARGRKTAVSMFQIRKRPSQFGKRHNYPATRKKATGKRPPSAPVDYRMREGTLPRPDIRIGLLDLPENACHFIYGDPGHEDHTFCGRPKSSGAYCAYHHQLTHDIP